MKKGATKIKQHPDWCKRDFQDFKAVKDAFERVLDIRGPERKAVRAYYKGNQYPAIENDRDLWVAYYFLKKVVEGKEDSSTSLTISLKCTIRAYANRPESPRRIVKDDGADGCMELIELSAFETLEGAESYFMAQYYMETPHSAYDCTGRAFTSWYKLFERRGYW